MRLLIHNARIALPDGELYRGDLLCCDGIITQIDRDIQENYDEHLDADGHVLMPGVFDPQVHFREPGKEYKENLATGSRAAAAGGVTSFLEMPNTSPATTTLEALQDKLARGQEKSAVNYGFFIGATPDNLDELHKTSKLACGIKIFMGSSTGSLLVDKEQDLERIFANGDKLIAVHAEDEERIKERTALFKERHDHAAHSEIRDEQSALLATQRAVALSHKYQRRLHVLHVSTGIETDFLAQEKTRKISCEVLPNHLFLNSSHYASLGALVQMNPPIRTEKDQERLWQGLREGTIDCIATDHAPHTLEEKNHPYPQSPSGMPGVETSLPLMLTAMRNGRCSLAEIQRWMCARPAELYGVKNKGRIAVGWDADLTIVDLESTHPVQNDRLFTKAGWSPFAGWELTGWPRATIVGGQIVFENGEIRPGVSGQALTYSA